MNSPQPRKWNNMAPEWLKRLWIGMIRSPYSAEDARIPHPFSPSSEDNYKRCRKIRQPGNTGSLRSKCFHEHGFRISAPPYQKVRLRCTRFRMPLRANRFLEASMRKIFRMTCVHDVFNRIESYLPNSSFSFSR